VAMFVDANTVTEVLQETQLAAEALGIKLQSIKIEGFDPDLKSAFRTATSQRAGALNIPPSPILERHRKRLVELAAKSHLPTMYFHSEFVCLSVS
jgi:hypothetical protein